jgi:1-acyl-sn-glycerol-3-phosphate acyltransferase
MIAKSLSKLYFKLSGWKTVGGIPPNVKKCIIVGAPHTSNWDFIYARLGLYIFDYKIRYLIKDSMFKNPIAAWFFRITGGIPVNRSKSSNLTGELAQLLKNAETLYIAIPPEGTRKSVKRWKTGFYRIAVDCNIPIALAILDYKKKQAGFIKILHPTGNIIEDFKVIESYYTPEMAANPDCYNPQIFERNKSK